jgi:hypothetical protein
MEKNNMAKNGKTKNRVAKNYNKNEKMKQTTIN